MLLVGFLPSTEYVFYREQSQVGELLHHGRINRGRQWYEMPTVSLKALNLLSLRLDLRDKNLFDSPNEQKANGNQQPPPSIAIRAFRQPIGRLRTAVRRVTRD